ncbi:MAG: hypothetical protein AB8F78_15540 [Saprospiraceae bacterium]
MKTILIRSILSLSIAFATLASSAQYTQFSTNPISLLYGVYKVEAEFPLGNHFAIEPEVAYLSTGQRFWFPDYDTKGHRMGLVMKKYFDKSMVYEGYYGFAYFRHVSMTFTDFQAEGELPDQRDFIRRRNVFGFGIGYSKVGLDGFFYGGAFGIGRHSAQNTKEYTSTLPEETISKAEDEDLFRTPIDVYGRISVGIRLYNQSGLEAKNAYEKAQQEEFERQREMLLNSNTEHIEPEQLDLEARRLRHRIKNGNG